MAERSYSLHETQRTSTGQAKKRFRVSEHETAFLTEELDDMDSPEELLLPDEHLEQKDPILRKWLNTNTLSENEEDSDERPSIKKESGVFSRVKLSSSCMCKLFVVLYLLGCLLVSTLYIAIYGPNELYLMPETAHNKIPKPSVTPQPVLQFYDNPYTEWIAQRWTYDKDPFADWPVIPDYISMLQQTVSGVIDSKKGVWLLDSEGLYFMYGIGAENYEEVSFVNISDNLDLLIRDGSRLSSRTLDSVYIVSPDDITLLDCSPSAVDYCEVSFHWSVPDLTSVSSAVVSGSDGHVWIGTENGLYRLNTTPPSQSPGNIATNNDIFSDENNATSSMITLIPDIEGPVISLAWRGGLPGPKGWGLESSAFLLTNSSHLHPQDVSFSTGTDLYNGGSDAPDQFGLLVIGTPKRIYFYDGHVTWFEWVSVWDDGIGGVVDGQPTAMTFVPSGELFIGNNVSLSRLNIDYTFDTLSGTEGLPYNQITTLHYSLFSPIYPSPLTQPPSASQTRSPFKGALWVGTKKGWSLFNVMNSEFVGYFYGPRWHPGQSILGISGAGDNTTVVVTDEGMSVVFAEEWTLEKKAEHYQEMLGRHIREPGLVADCTLSDFIPSSCSPGHTDNDGLWTSWLVAAEALRYQVTKCEDARSNAWRFYRGVKFLVDVTGITGLPARSVVKVNVSSKDDDYGESGWGEETPPPTADVPGTTSNVSGYDKSWHNSTTKPGWIWKGDTSSDEIVGHLFANTIAYDLLAQSQEEKQEVMTMLDSIIGYIKDNNYTLVDVTNRTTRWGIWTPTVINLNQSWADDHGLGPLEILSGLLSAFRITEKAEYFEAWQELFNGSYNGAPSHYGLNMINQKITFPRDINYSDDELAFLSYFVYFQSLRRLPSTDRQYAAPEMFYIPMLSLNRAWNSVKKERSAAWHSIYGNITGDSGLTEDIVWSLRNWPLELVQWGTENSHRLDIQFRRGEDRFSNSNSQSQRVLPPRERTQLRWNGNPYSLDFNGSSNEMDPGPWLMSYWLAKWSRLL